MTFHVFAAECAGCGHRWLAVIEGDLTFGLQCRACDEMRGRKITPRMPCDTEDEALALAKRLTTDDEPTGA